MIATRTDDQFALIPHRSRGYIRLNGDASDGSAGQSAEETEARRVVQCSPARHEHEDSRRRDGLHRARSGTLCHGDQSRQIAAARDARDDVDASTPVGRTAIRVWPGLARAGVGRRASRRAQRRSGWRLHAIPAVPRQAHGRRGDVQSAGRKAADLVFAIIGSSDRRQFQTASARSSPQKPAGNYAEIARRLKNLSRRSRKQRPCPPFRSPWSTATRSLGPPASAHSTKTRRNPPKPIPSTASARSRSSLPTWR